ncbi:type II toxin-antitoxin system PrlF family antitoxin [Rhizobium sp. C4]|uniref:type II toxin-antitoxin system PrlF family antitoxin n=1 Tax=Rhizobium sp. C4 TaxID=1349800 RepID=UPI001E50A2AE|nr:type II toxin-antitoxin system PrlF family antitoxin [Rhizobium sp. C4]MCD2173005.1 type II toxin-antitoxin system PrlF family antitoxin [Rhizobium sp. C4]
MASRATIEIDATITERGQTTVPAAIRKMLGVRKGGIVFKGLADGTVVIEPKREADESDPVLDEFLAFLERDIPKNAAIKPLDANLLHEIDTLIEGVEVDLDAPLPDD